MKHHKHHEHKGHHVGGDAAQYKTPAGNKDMIHKAYYNRSESGHEKPIHTEMGKNPKWTGC